MAKHIIRGTGAPTQAPAFYGQHYIDESAGTHYLANGITDSSDWQAVGSGGSGGAGRPLVSTTDTRNVTMPGTGALLWQLNSLDISTLSPDVNVVSHVDDGSYTIIAAGTDLIVFDQATDTVTTISPSGGSNTIVAVADDGAGGYMALDASGTTYYSTDPATTWTATATNPGFTAWTAGGLASDGAIWVAVGENGAISTSNDNGATWTSRTSNTAGHFYGLFRGSQFVAWTVGEVLLSADGITWTTAAVNPGGAIQTIAYDGTNWFWILQWESTIYYSADDFATSATAFTLPSSGRLTTDETGAIFAYAGSGELYSATPGNATTWNLVATEPNNDLQYLVKTDGQNFMFKNGSMLSMTADLAQITDILGGSGVLLTISNPPSGQYGEVIVKRKNLITSYDNVNFFVHNEAGVFQTMQSLSQDDGTFELSSFDGGNTWSSSGSGSYGF